MESMKLVVVLLASIALVCALPPPEKISPEVTIQSKTPQEDNLFLHGSRIVDDFELLSGRLVLSAKQKVNEREVWLGSYKEPVITFIEFKYNSMDEKLPNCTLYVADGGAGDSWVKFGFTSESKRIKVEYKIFGIHNKPQGR